jgi:ATPase subunit of ABC transporter with duplicated ATPase domains
MIELNIHNLNKYYGARQIFNNISFDLRTGERAGLIGQNGCGKTTIFKILMGLEDYQGGEISIRKGARMGYLDQIPDYEDGVSTLDVLQTAFEEVHRMKLRMKELEEQFGSLEGEQLNRALETYSRLTEQYELSGGYELETRINKTTEGLQISEQMLMLPFQALSGGEKTRVILAKILLEEPDILLLDEPSNHLDLAAIEWLEGFLREYPGAVLVISHDRYFLDAVAGKIIELKFDHAELYPGNYSYYVTEKERRFLIELKNYQNEQKKIDRMEEQIERYRIWGEMRDSEKMFKRAKELEKRLEKLDTPKKPIHESRKIRLDQKVNTRTGKIVLEIDDLYKSFEDKELIQGIGLNLYYQDSACIIGRNGCGKSTLLKMVVGELEADRGKIRIGSQVTVGYLPQHVEYEDEERTILEYFSRLHNLTIGEARSQLARVLFLKEDVNKKIKFLSGGEKSRLKLCSLTYEGANFLILDEPTNHLDIDSREVLEETLMNYTGTLLFVSHDRYFINKVADKIMTLEDTGLKIYDGDYTYYQEELKKVRGNETKLTPEAGNYRNTSGRLPAANRVDKSARNRESDSQQINRNLKTKQPQTDRSRSYRSGMKAAKSPEQLEEEIEVLEIRKSELEKQMEQNSSDAARLKELYDQLEQLDRSLLSAYEEWEQAQSEILYNEST